VVVTTTPGANAAAVAELTLALMLALCRELPRAEREVRDGGWPTLAGRELGSMTVGLVGLGRVGLRVARLLRGHGAEVLAYDPYAGPQSGIRQVGRDELAAAADILSLHAPATPETRGMVDRELLGRLREGALLVNTARGELIDEDALLWALDEGPLAAAALDALAQEPPYSGHPLVGRADVIVTPHIGGQTAEARAAMARVAVDELLTVLDGRDPRFRVAA
jgi:D-3-phosphoglycerate dehydrogenase